MGDLNVEELYARSRSLFIDLLKLGLSLSTATIGALSFFIFKFEDLSVTVYQLNLYNTALILLFSAIVCALLGWFAQAIFYASWAHHFPDEKNHRNKWKNIRNISLSLFTFLFLMGLILAALFIKSFITIKP